MSHQEPVAGIGDGQSSGAALEALAARLAPTFPSADDARIALALLRLLARGQRVSFAALSGRTRLAQEEVVARISSWPNVERDDDGDVIGFGGLTLRPTPHVFEVGGGTLYTWCAWDPFFLPALLETTARVTSTCPVTSRKIEATIAPNGVLDVRPAHAEVSFPPPAQTDTKDIRGSFCCEVHFLAGRAAAKRWRTERPGALTLDVTSAYELGRLATEHLAAGA